MLSKNDISICKKEAGVSRFLADGRERGFFEDLSAFFMTSEQIFCGFNGI